MEPGVRVTKTTEVHTWDENNNPQRHVQVYFMVNTHGPFTMTFPMADFDSFKVEAALDDFARKIKRLTPPA